MSMIVRTKTRAEGGITLEEKAQMDLIAKKWTANAFRTDPIEPDKITDAVKRLYAASGLDEPRVVIATSPLVMAFAYGASAAIWHQRKNPSTVDDTFDATRDATRDATLSATADATADATFDATLSATVGDTFAATFAATVGDTADATLSATADATFDATLSATVGDTADATLSATFATTRDATFVATRSATFVATRDATFDATFDATREAENGASNACFALGGDLGISCAREWSKVYQGGNMWSHFCAYIDAARNVLGLDLPEYKAFTPWNDCALHGGFRVMHEKFCIVSDFPEFIKIDDENRPHCETGPSHRWRDGWSLYHWHGVSVPAEWIENEPPMEAAINHDNVEQRRAAAEIIGWSKVLNALGAIAIDTDCDPEIGQLLEVDLPDIGRERFIRVKCGTGRDFALPVPPEMKTALQAQAWMVGLEPHEFKTPEVRT